jgi:hypothetical protein
MGEPVLCYVKGDTAYFTTQELSKQWGDDWNDAPYEHNAGRPNEPSMHYYSDGRQEKRACDWNEDGTPKWEIIEVKFSSDLYTPEDWHYGSSPFSVEDINVGIAPWLATSKYSSDPKITIFAGATIEEFKRKVRESGGKIYVEEKEDGE